MLPVLTALGDDESKAIRDLVEPLSDQFKLTPDERSEMLPTGRSTRMRNRVYWAALYLVQSGLLSRPRRGLLQITEDGKRVLDQHPTQIDNKFLEQFPPFLDFMQRTHTTQSEDAERPQAQNGHRVSTLTSEDGTPEEVIDAAWRMLRTQTGEELLSKVKSSTPEFFERLVVDLLVGMGYGGSFVDAARAVGQSGDGGIDGVIKEDKLGLDAVYLQAKKWEGTVGRPEIQRFAGSLEGQRATKGVFLTTGTFSREAREYVQQISRRISLIDGAELVSLMMDHGVGVSTGQTYVVSKVDEDFFEDN